MTVENANVLPGEGTLFQVEIASTYTTVAQVIEVTGPETMVAAIDKTVLTSTLIITRPSKLPNPDKCSLKIYFDGNDNNTQILITGDVTTPGTIRNFKIVFVDGDTTPQCVTFSGYFTSFKLNGLKVEENVGADVEIKPTTVFTFVPGTP
jgi:hypothetical protein